MGTNRLDKLQTDNATLTAGPDLGGGPRDLSVQEGHPTALSFIFLTVFRIQSFTTLIGLTLKASDSETSLGYKTRSLLKNKKVLWQVRQLSTKGASYQA